jgi:hypothetical protein
VIVLAGVLFIASTAPSIGRLYGTPTYPVTSQVLTVVGGSFWIFILVVLTIYAGELVWRERDAGMAQIHDALPYSRWTVVAAKVSALVAIEALLLAVVIVAGVTIQALKGFPDFELGLYFRSAYGIHFVLFGCLCVLAVLAHVLINQKYVGHFAMVVFLAPGLLFPLLGLEHHLYRYATVPTHPYSAMNGYGHFVAPMAWFELYWVAVAAALAVVANLFWVRGTPQRFRERHGRHGRLGRGAAAVLGVALAVARGGGSSLEHQRPQHLPQQVPREEMTARYERLYKPGQALTNPGHAVRPSRHLPRSGWRCRPHRSSTTGKPVEEISHPSPPISEVPSPGARARLRPGRGVYATGCASPAPEQ